MAKGVHGDQQVGWAQLGSEYYASLWNGTAASWTNLHLLLPVWFRNSEANGIWSSAGFTYVVGSAYNSSTGRNEAVMWVGPWSCRVDYDGDHSVGVPDIFAFLSAWFAGDLRANFNGDGFLNVADIFAFLSAWFAGCP